METATDQVLQEAQEKLLSMRKERKVTMSHGLSLQSTDLSDVIERCKQRSEEAQKNGVIPLPVTDEASNDLKPVSVLGACGVDKKYRGCTFETFHGGDRLVGVLKQMARDGESVLLAGNTGCGKTHLAVAMMAEFVKRRMDALFITLPDMLLEIRSSFSEKSEVTEKHLVELYSAKQLLVLDDLGAEKPSEFTIATLYLILDRRIRQERQTIITTNLKSMREIADYAGARIASRISEMELVAVNLPDWRKKRK